MVFLPVARSRAASKHGYTPDLILHYVSLSRHSFESEDVVVQLVSKVRGLKDANLVLRELQVLLTVFASKRLRALRLYRLPRPVL